jgi:hypothetical protein
MLMALSAGSLLGQVRPEVPCKLLPLAPGALKIGGHLGRQIDLCIDKRILAQDIDALAKPFLENSDGRNTWRCEFWGKWACSAAGAHRYRHDDQTKTKALQAVTKILASQSPEGYIGTQANADLGANWDVWGRKYTLLGLIEIHRAAGDAEALTAATKLADHFIAQVASGKVDVTRLGRWHGMASSSIIEPLAELYLLTGQKRYRLMAQHIVDSWEKPEGNHLMAKALGGKDVYEMFPGPQKRKKGKRPSYSHMGQSKAYEMMSCYEGVLELYRLTGTEVCRKAVEKVYDNILETEITAIGSGSDWERWCRGASTQTRPMVMGMETCVSVYWMKLSADLLALTGEMRYGDELERTMYNALLGAQCPDGAWWVHHAQTAGQKERAPKQCGMDQNCCVANGPRGMMLIPQVAVMQNAAGLSVNLYGRIDAEAQLPGVGKVGLEISGDYPAGGAVSVEVSTDRPAPFTLQLRVPAWSERTFLWVNGTKVPAAPRAGAYRLTRRWSDGDKVELILDMRTRAVPNDSKTHYCIRRGPIVFVRDRRFAQGEPGDTVDLIADEEGCLAGARLVQENLPEGVWMGLQVPVREADGKQGSMMLVDFASAGATMDATSAYRIWLPAPAPAPQQP